MIAVIELQRLVLPHIAHLAPSPIAETRELTCYLHLVAPSIMVNQSNSTLSSAPWLPE